MFPTLRHLLALVGGLALCTIIESSGSAVGRALVPWIEPLGTLLVDGIRMTMIPLVVTSLVVGITSAPDTRTIGRLGGRALGFMVVTISFAAMLGIVAAGPLFGLLSIDPVAAESLRASAAGAERAVGEELVGHLRDHGAPRAVLVREALVVDRLQAVQMIGHQSKQRRRLRASGLVDAARRQRRVGHARSGTGERRELSRTRMASNSQTSTRAGRSVAHPAGYRAFEPAPLPPEPPLQLAGDLQRLLSDADRALGRLDGSGE